MAIERRVHVNRVCAYKKITYSSCFLFRFVAGIAHTRRQHSRTIRQAGHVPLPNLFKCVNNGQLDLD